MVAVVAAPLLLALRIPLQSLNTGVQKPASLAIERQGKGDATSTNATKLVASNSTSQLKRKDIDHSTCSAAPVQRNQT